MHELVDAFNESERLVQEFLPLLELPLIDSDRVRIADTACSLSIEQWSWIVGARPVAVGPGRSPHSIRIARSKYLAHLAGARG